MEPHLLRVSEQIGLLKHAKSLVEFESAWQEYLHRLERAWNKASAFYKHNPKWPEFKAEYADKRRKDELLAYLTNARGADEHTVEEIVERIPGGLGIGPANGNELYIEKLVFSGGVIQ